MPHRWAPAVDADQLFLVVEIDIGQSSIRRSASDQSHLIADEGRRHGSLRNIARSASTRRIGLVLAYLPIACQRQLGVVLSAAAGRRLRPRCAWRCHVESVTSASPLPSLVTRKPLPVSSVSCFQPLTIGPDACRHEGQPQHIGRARRRVVGAVTHAPSPVDDGIHHGRGPHDVVLACRPELGRQPSQRTQQVLQRHRMSDLEPGVIDDETAVDVVFRDARFVSVIGSQNLHAAGKFPRPGTVSLLAVLRERNRQFHRPVPQRSPAATTRLGISPRTAEDFASRHGTYARVIEKQRQHIPRVGAPRGKHVRIVHEIACGELGHVFRLHIVDPIPVIAPPDVVDRPLTRAIDRGGTRGRHPAPRTISSSVPV